MSALEIPEIREWLADLANQENDESRLKFLELQCGSDQDLVKRVWDAWRNFQYKARKRENAKENPSPEDSEDCLTYVDPNINQLIGGKYKLLELIGEGGMGSIYKAQEVHPVKVDRYVALKLVKSGLDSKKVLARFRAERTAIGVMDHPSIAKIFDAGATPSGLPFFVMELVPGEPITSFCDKHRLTVAERLKLFIKVCDAIQHAHQKGVIHRDIKPGNILVMSDQGQPLPKVIDFGVAKALFAKVGEETPLTAFDSIIGTPEYMSPEQASFNTMEVDTRSDVYSLGVLLYELIIGSTPFDRRAHAKTGVLEMLRHVRENDPPTPSIKLSTEISLSQIAATRSTEGYKLANLLKGELDWIILKALDKDPNRRYESPAAFGRDIQRYLDDEVVEARPPAALYQAGKFFRRYKLQVIAAGLVVLALIGGVIGTTIGMLEAQAQRRTAVARLTQFEEGMKVLSAIFLALDPREQENSALPLDQLIGQQLDLAIEQIKSGDVGTEQDRAKLLVLLGNSQKGLGFSEKSIAVLTIALNTYENTLPVDDPKTLACLDYLGRAYLIAKEYREAIKYLTLAYGKRAIVLGEQDPDTLESLGHLGIAHRRNGEHKQAVKMLTKVVEEYEELRGPDNRSTLYWLAELGTAQIGTKDLAKAASNLKKSYDRMIETGFPKDHSNVLFAATQFGQVYRHQRNNEEFLKWSRIARDGYQNRLGLHHNSTLLANQTLSEALLANNKADEAAALAKSTYLKWQELGTTKTSFALTALEHAGKCLTAANKSRERVDFLQENLAFFINQHGEANENTLHVKILLQVAKLDRAEYDTAITLGNEIRKALQGQEQNLQSKKLYVRNLASLARACQLRGSDRKEKNKENLPEAREAAFADLRQSATHFQEVVTMIKEDPKCAWNPWDLSNNLVFLSSSLSRQEKWDESEAPMREALHLYETTDPKGIHNDICRVQLGIILQHRSKVTEARSILQSALTNMENLPQKDGLHLNFIKKAKVALEEIKDLQEKTPNLN